MSSSRGIELRIGLLTLDLPRSVGYFGGIVLAVGAGLIEPPLGLFIAAVPFMKMLSNNSLPRGVRVVGDVLGGAAQPVGSDAEGTIRIADPQRDAEEAAQTVELVEKGLRQKGAEAGTRSAQPEPDEM